MSPAATLKQLQNKFIATYWRLVGTDEEWRKQLIRNELRSIGANIAFLQSIIR